MGKGLSGGKIIVFPPKHALYMPEETILIGNTSLYGGTQGKPIATAWRASGLPCGTAASGRSSKGPAITAAST